LLSAQRQTNEDIPELEDQLELPETANMVWRWFIDLNNSRQSGMGVNPISYSEMLSYFALMNIAPMEWEIQAIKTLDNIALKHYAKQQEADSKTK
jgi:hypothetical protein